MTTRSVGMAAVMMMMMMMMVASVAHAQGAKPLMKCPPDAVVAGAVCMDKYEASVWRVANPTTANKGLVKRIQQGKATAADLAKGAATPLGLTGDDYAPCSDSGQDCADDIYAVSLAGVKPSSYQTWFQAQAACRNARKRLPSNAEWQAAVAGTPDPGPDDALSDCNTTNGANPTLTGARSKCVSALGAFDMVGNLAEWVADWLPRSPGCGTWSPGVSPNDDQCLAGAATTGEPAAPFRGGSFVGDTSAGPLEINNRIEPSIQFASSTGFRCAR